MFVYGTLGCATRRRSVLTQSRHLDFHRSGERFMVIKSFPVVKYGIEKFMH